MTVRSIANLMFLFLVASCASYEPKSSYAPVTPRKWVSATNSNLTASADPYVEADRQKAMFDAEFGKLGMLVTRIQVGNQTPNLVLVRRSDVLLALPDGRRIASVSGHSAAIKAGEDSSVTGAFYAFGIIGGLVASEGKHSALDARIADYESKEFKDSTLAQGESAGGFVFFKIPPGTEAFDNARVEVRFLDVRSAAGTVVSLPLSGLGFSGTSPSDSQAK